MARGKFDDRITRRMKKRPRRWHRERGEESCKGPRPGLFPPGNKSARACAKKRGAFPGFERAARALRNKFAAMISGRESGENFGANFFGGFNAALARVIFPNGIAKSGLGVLRCLRFEEVSRIGNGFFFDEILVVSSVVG